MQKEIENFKFVQGVKFELIDSLKNNSLKYSFFFDVSCESICNFDAFIDISTAGKHLGLKTNYSQQNLFHQSRLGRDVAPQNTHIFLLKSLHDMMQVSTISAQLGSRS